MKKLKTYTSCGHCGNDIGKTEKRCKCKKCGYINYWHEDLGRYKAYSDSSNASSSGRTLI